MSDTREIYISRAFGEVVQLIEIIEVVAMRDDDYGIGTIEILKDLIAEGQEDANEAREKLHALRAAAELLIVALRGV
jgi:ferritin